MYASELVGHLNHLIAMHGDLPISNEYGYTADVPEFNDDDGPCILMGFEEE